MGFERREASIERSNVVKDIDLTCTAPCYHVLVACTDILKMPDTFHLADGHMGETDRWKS